LMIQYAVILCDLFREGEPYSVSASFILTIYGTDVS
jgi:hypothetical protein